MAKRRKIKKAKRRTSPDSESVIKASKSIAKRSKGFADTLGDHPILLETIAAVLVAAAGALRQPSRKRSEESSARKTGVLWLLALDIAQRSIETLAREREPRTRRSKARGKL